MSATNFPSPILAHRRADMAVHSVGLILILVAGWFLLTKAAGTLDAAMIAALAVYVFCALVSNLASWAYHFAPLHHWRKLLRQIDHAAIYPSISGTFTPFFVLAGTSWTTALIWLCWSLTAVAIWKKITDENVKSKWSTASYLGLGAIGLSALPHLTMVPFSVLWCILAGAASYVLGTGFYARKSMPYRYAIWHSFVNLGGVFMFAGVWIALFSA